MTPVATLDESTEAILLATRILASAPRILVVTSCEDGAGKTTLCKLLATVAMERMNRPVVYLDLNLRHPAHRETFAASPFASRFEFRVPGPDFGTLPGWEKRQRIAGLLEHPSEDALMIVDTSPLGIFNRNNIHPVQLAEWVKEFILVVAQESSRHSQIREAKALLATHGLTISGAILNQHGNPNPSDSASITGWRTLYRMASKARRNLPGLLARTKSSVHALRILWRLERPGIRRACNRVAGFGPVRAVAEAIRRASPGTFSRMRQFLSSLRSWLDRRLGKADRRWTRN